MKQHIALHINGSAREAHVTPRTHLADFLRENLHLTGTHVGCEHGVCGACTLMVNDQPVRSCITFVAACDGARVRTIEGFDNDPLMAALREAFSAHHALQCGYCTPGMLMTAYDIVRRVPRADERRVREELSGNLCRCTGYAGIVKAICAVIDAPPELSALEAPLPVAPPLGTLRWVAPRRTELPQAIASEESAREESATPLDGHGGNYRVEVATDATALWQVLRDVEQVVQCLPGASLQSAADEDPLLFQMQVSLGPMRVVFEGEAHVHYEDEDMRAQVTGRGHDVRTRSSGEGTLQFAVHSLTDERCELDVALRHELAGPLAQFSRSPVVDAVVEHMLQRFVANATRLTRGDTVKEQSAVGSLEFGLGALWRMVKSWFTR